MNRILLAIVLLGMFEKGSYMDSVQPKNVGRCYETFSRNRNDQLQEGMFLGQSVNVSRYDQQKYPSFDRLTEKQLSFFWRPEEVNVAIDGVQYPKLLPHEKHIFISNLKYQTLMDSIQGRSPNMLFLPVVSIPELETWIETWAFSETIHSRSYTHIIRAIEPQPDRVFNDIVINPEIGKRAESISRYYDSLHEYNVLMDAYAKGYVAQYDRREHMRRIYLALHTVNILEAIRFYVSFACSFAFAERGLMEGNAKIIKFIARDEMLHLAGTQKMIRCLQSGQEGSDWMHIAHECEQEAAALFMNAAEQEMQWAQYLFRDGAMLGLNEKILVDYVKYLVKIRMEAVQLPCPLARIENPIPWINAWFSSDEVQAAPQEVELTSYLTNQINSDVSQHDLLNIDL